MPDKTELTAEWMGDDAAGLGRTSEAGSADWKFDREILQRELD